MTEQDKWRAEADRLSALCDDTLKAIRYGPNAAEDSGRS